MATGGKAKFVQVMTQTLNGGSEIRDGFFALSVLDEYVFANRRRRGKKNRLR